MIVEGRIADVIFLLGIFGSGLYLMFLKKEWVPTFRRIAGLDAIEEAIGRATEMGRPVFFTSGLSSLSRSLAPQIIAGMAVLEHIAEHCAKNNTRLIVGLGQSDVIPLATEIIRESCIRAGVPEQFRPEDIVYFSNQEFPYCVGVQGLIQREKPAANIMVGPFYGDQIAFAEVGYRVGAVQIGGTARIVQIPFFAVVCDYVLIGEEIFAVGAYLSKDPIQLSSIAAQDIFKLIASVIILIGVALVAAGSDVMISLLSK